MKKYLVTVFVVLSMMAMIVGTVGAAPKASGTTFLGAVYTAGGATFTFNVDENLSRGQLKAIVSWDGGSVGITCSQDGDTVTCSAPRSVVDKNITISFQGTTFATYVKSQPFCYSVWDYDDDLVWHDYGSYCQDAPAGYGDMVSLEVNPYYPGFWEYLFLPNGYPCVDIAGDAYYFCTD